MHSLVKLAWQMGPESGSRNATSLTLFYAQPYWVSEETFFFFLFNFLCVCMFSL